MITIYKDGTQLEVTRGAYKDIFSRLGWSTKIVPLDVEKTLSEDLVEPEEKPVLEEQESLIEMPEDIEDDEEIEIPLSEMSVKELRAYAEEHDIDVSEARNKSGLRDIINSALED